MSEAQNQEPDAPRKRSKLPLVIGIVLMILGAGGGFYLTYSGLLPGLHGTAQAHGAAGAEVAPLDDIAFVPIDPLVVSLGSEPGGRYLHFKAQIEVAKAFEADVRLILPRIVDVLNGYLRAVEVRELEDPTALVRLRAQMLRRVRMVAGEERVRDVLVTEFVIN